MAGGHDKRYVTRSWMSDTPDEIEHPPIPLGLNSMAVPRAAIVLSIGTVVVLIVSSIWVGLSAMAFLDDLDTSFGSKNVELLKSDGRWVWEVDLLFDTCSAREDNWNWPENLSDQDDVFLYPGELRCDWEHQGDGDAASVAVYNRGNGTLDLVMEVSGGGVTFSASGEPHLIINGLEGGESMILEISLEEGVSERDVSVIATHVSVLEAQVRLDVHILEGTENRDLHINDGDRINVHYTVWDADTGEELDDGDLLVTAGDDPAYIDGFGWSAIGLDIDNDRGLFPTVDTGTSHTTLLPPPIAYGNSDGHELQDSWLRFELKINQGPIT